MTKGENSVQELCRETVGRRMSEANDIRRSARIANQSYESDNEGWTEVKKKRYKSPQSKSKDSMSPDRLQTQEDKESSRNRNAGRGATRSVLTAACLFLPFCCCCR